MKNVITFSSKTEGRDKFCKVIQYGCRMLKDILTDPEVKTRLNGLFTVARDSRKMFRLGKSIHEVQTILDTVGNINMGMVNMALQICSRTAFFVYWIFDNLQLLATFKVIKKDPKSLSKVGMTAWFIAILFSLALLIRKLSANYTSETKARSRLAGDPQLLKKTLTTMSTERTVIVLNIIKNLGDILPASNGANVPQTLFNKGIPERWNGLGGLISALISCYQTWS